ncbi:Microtubule-nucleating Tub4p (gamma-tubulin) complex component, partial [Spiromyces aspiralis]
MANPHPHPAQRRPPLARRSTVSGEEYTQPPTTSRPDAYLYRRLKVIDNVTEEELIRDLIYVMQGIDGKYIVWDSRWQTFDIRPGVVISGAACDLTRRLTEVGRLYRYISEYTEAASRTGGLVAQSLCSELQEELREHYKLVAILEAQQAKVEPGILPGESSRGLTLRRLNSWITEPLQKLRLIDSIVEKCKGKYPHLPHPARMCCVEVDIGVAAQKEPMLTGKGGQMLSQIHTFTVNGDPFINSLSNRLLSAASEPFNDMLVRWITIGELVDPHEECFIREDPNVPPEDMWRNRYSINYDMIPVYMDPEITKKIFLIG